MTEMKNIKISECEEVIMKIIWGQDEDPDLDTVTNKAGICFGKKWKKQTVATFMIRLKNKGWINIYKIGRRSHYHPLVTLEKYRKDKMAEFFELYPQMEKKDVLQKIIELAEETANKE